MTAQTEPDRVVLTTTKEEKMTHASAHPLAGKTVVLSSGPYAGQEFRVEDYWDRISGQSWTVSAGNPACMKYAIAQLDYPVPMDDEVLYGKTGLFGNLVHTSWL
ncbi:hypothetical protein KNU71_gp103 [Streptomyces phage Braelyn]|uniref:Uncharacterized protein n=1 Tax=Streptomyces phage Braelyn TaxID=2593356 RepID=A0A514U232_9CAUD|nr:hypothetical protein KNU71_gp103 [Streptomyces phage Braelyn]QDK03014.1 hypothetical protein SEA_BRAELYN_195 [Streptomyces phage Braelyn]